MVMAVVVLSPGSQPWVINAEVMALATGMTIAGFLGARASINKLSSCIRAAKRTSEERKA